MADQRIDSWEAIIREMRRRVSLVSAEPLTGPAQLPTVLSNSITTNGVKDLVRSFPDAVRYLNARRSKPFASIKSEADVQDLLYLMLKPSIPALQFETPTSASSSSYSIADFWIEDLRLLIECKFVDQRSDVKRVANEIAEDIWKYGKTTECEDLVFFVYDPNLVISNRQQFIRASSAEAGSLVIAARTVTVEVVVVPA